MRPLRFIRAVGVGVAIFANRRPIATMVAIPYCGLVVWLLITNRLTETPEQLQARATAEGQAAAAREDARASAEADRERKQRLCAVKEICARYGRARQDSAPAADFDRCIRIKMGAEGYEVLDACTDGGHLKAQSQPAEPGAVECWFNRP
jgi:hypothetical protein